MRNAGRHGRCSWSLLGAVSLLFFLIAMVGAGTPVSDRPATGVSSGQVSEKYEYRYNYVDRSGRLILIDRELGALFGLPGRP